jgi:membrane-associated phospholipid phosphatase
VSRGPGPGMATDAGVPKPGLEPDVTPRRFARRRAVTEAEVCAIVRIQAMTAAPGAWRGALLLSRAGEHAACWIAFGLTGAALDARQRRSWLRATVAVAGAHMLSVALKRLVRRPRPSDPRIEVRLRAPGRWGFPSSHATSTAAAAVAYSRLLGRRLPLVSVPLMLASRVAAGLHYPSDVLAGAVMGGLVGRWAGDAAPRRS